MSHRGEKEWVNYVFDLDGWPLYWILGVECIECTNY